MALTLNVHIVETGVFAQRPFAITHSVTLDIGFGCHIDTILVTQFIPSWVVGIVRSANSVHVQLLHHLNVLNHTVHTYHITTIRIQFVAVHTLDEDGLAIHEQLLILDFHFAETDALRDALKEFVAIIE